MGNLTVKESGEMVNFISPNVSKITSFKVHFSPRQEGTGDPSPENVREITGWNGVEGHGCGKNLVPWIKTNLNIQTSYYNGFAGWSKLWEIPKRISYTYSVFIDNSNCSTGGGVRVWLRDVDNSKYTHVVDGKKINAGEKGFSTVTLDFSNLPNDYYAYWGLDLHPNAIASMPIVYESDQETAIISDWSSNIGTVYGGYVDLTSGELVQTIKRVEFTWGDCEDSTILGNTERRYIMFNDNRFKTINSLKTKISNIFSTFLDNSSWNVDKVSCAFGNKTIICKLPVGSDNNTIIQVAGDLAEPITHQLTPQQLSTLKGQNNFWSNADYVEIEYELTETFDIQKAKRKIILNQPHVESASGDIVTFDTDMKGKLKECKVYFSPVQEGEGDPSPENIRPISGWTEVNIYDDPKYEGNIIWNQCLDLSTITISSSSSSVLDVTTTKTGFNVVLNDDVSTSGSRVVYFSINWNRTQNHRYIFLCKISNTLNYSSLYIYHSNGSTNRAYSSDINEQFFGWESYDGSTSEAKTTLRLYIYGIDMKAGESFEVSNLMAIDLDEMFGTSIIDELYENTTTSAQKIEWFKNIIKNYNYREYNTGEVTTVSAINGDPYTSISINWTDEVGTVYGGYVDLVSGELVADWYSVSTTAWEQYNQSNGYKAYRAANQPNHASGIPMLCNVVSIYASFNSGNMTGNAIQPHSTIVGGVSTIYLGLDENIDISNVQVVWKLTEPIHYQLTPQQLLTLKGTNNVYSDANGQTEIKYWKH